MLIGERVVPLLNKGWKCLYCNRINFLREHTDIPYGGQPQPNHSLIRLAELGTAPAGGEAAENKQAENSCVVGVDWWFVSPGIHSLASRLRPDCSWHFSIWAKPARIQPSAIVATGDQMQDKLWKTLQ
jgi:hypothetical protein